MKFLRIIFISLVVGQLTIHPSMSWGSDTLRSLNVKFPKKADSYDRHYFKEMTRKISYLQNEVRPNWPKVGSVFEDRTLKEWAKEFEKLKTIAKKTPWGRKYLQTPEFKFLANKARGIKRYSTITSIMKKCGIHPKNLKVLQAVKQGYFKEMMDILCKGVNIPAPARELNKVEFVFDEWSKNRKRYAMARGFLTQTIGDGAKALIHYRLRYQKARKNYMQEMYGTVPDSKQGPRPTPTSDTNSPQKTHFSGLDYKGLGDHLDYEDRIERKVDRKLAGNYYQSKITPTAKNIGTDLMYATVFEKSSSSKGRKNIKVPSDKYQYLSLY